MIRENIQEKLIQDVSGFNKLSNFIFEKIGISMPLNDKNLALMASRLTKILYKYDIPNYHKLHEELLKNQNHDLLQDLISKLTTHTTHFFREIAHFQFLSEQFQNNSKHLEIWCAASSTGEEPWSIAICLDKIGISFRILATDIDTHALEIARQGIYEREDLKNISDHDIEKYFVLGKKPYDNFLKVKTFLKKKTIFCLFNLYLQDYGILNKFDVIFCRNVLIYFSKEQIQQIVIQLSRALKPGGFLLVGHSETLMGIKDTGLTKIKPSIFRKD